MQKFLVPAALLVSLIIVVIAISFFRGNAPLGDTAPKLDATNIPAVTTSDHIQGDIKAPITIIEYSDIECPYCKLFEGNVKRVMSEYGPSGKVAWVFRNFPLPTVHPNAPKHAEAAECVASLKGNQAFFDFIDALHTKAPGEERFDPKGYPAIVATLGVDEKAFESCLAAGTFKDHIAANTKEAMDAGARGTPFVIFVGSDGSKVPFGGMLTYEQIKQLIDQALLLPIKATTSTPTPN